MNTLNYKLERIQYISFNAFFNLIQTNKTYIQKGFSGTVKRCETKETSEKLFKEWVSEENNNNCFTFFIKDTIKNTIVGLINIKNIDYSVNKCEIGYFIAKDYAGNGLVSKFTSEIVTYCFDILHMNKIFIRIAPENIGSQKVALKNGFKQEGILREEYKGHLGKLEDVMYFGLLKGEYLKDKT
ncbi:hypothetical protein A8C32_19275 [Flavivirga aquatica]|uniref:N-acetyltransferase domain-containing protein n=1 Tax=Flavivirga aquatica TaxID=1849968 RepID=A0A1E5T469_9FLAO|nr:GNAT family protein [Flavivirga aquatica]OEK06170.1 hypothetical protein A8C32_19275 [Flavivirga aquatica]